jgi:hypothetical protein
MIRTFYIGQNALEITQQIDISTASTLQHLKGIVGKVFSFADPECKSFSERTPEIRTEAEISLLQLFDSIRRVTVSCPR